MQNILHLLEDWVPDLHPVHCAHCRHAVVYHEDAVAMARCDQGRGPTHGHGVELRLLLRGKHPYAWRSAAECTAYSPMGED